MIDHIRKASPAAAETASHYYMATTTAWHFFGDGRRLPAMRA